MSVEEIKLVTPLAPRRKVVTQERVIEMILSTQDFEYSGAYKVVPMVQCDREGFVRFYGIEPVFGLLVRVINPSEKFQEDGEELQEYTLYIPLTESFDLFQPSKFLGFQFDGSLDSSYHTIVRDAAIEGVFPWTDFAEVDPMIEDGPDLDDDLFGEGNEMYKDEEDEFDMGWSGIIDEDLEPEEMFDPEEDQDVDQ